MMPNWTDFMYATGAAGRNESQRSRSLMNQLAVQNMRGDADRDVARTGAASTVLNRFSDVAPLVGSENLLNTAAIQSILGNVNPAHAQSIDQLVPQQMQADINATEALAHQRMQPRGGGSGSRDRSLWAPRGDGTYSVDPRYTEDFRLWLADNDMGGAFSRVGEENGRLILAPIQGNNADLEGAGP